MSPIGMCYMGEVMHCRVKISHMSFHRRITSGNLLVALIFSFASVATPDFANIVDLMYADRVIWLASAFWVSRSMSTGLKRTVTLLLSFPLPRCFRLLPFNRQESDRDSRFCGVRS